MEGRKARSWGALPIGTTEPAIINLDGKSHPDTEGTKVKELVLLTET